MNALYRAQVGANILQRLMLCLIVGVRHQVADELRNSIAH